MATSKGATVLSLVTDAYGGHGGIALYNRDVLDGLAGLDSISNILVLPRHGNSENHLPHKVSWIHQAAGGKAVYLFQLIKTLLVNRKLSVIMCGHINLLPMADFARRISGAPIILFIYGIDAWQAPNSRMTRNLLRHVAKVISISAVTRDRFLAWAILQQPVVLVPNAIDVDHFRPGPPDPQLMERYGMRGKKVLMTLARLDSRQRHKGVDEILDVLPSLVEAVPNLVFLVCGKGDDLQRLRNKAADSGMEQHVVFAGYVDESEKAAHYRLADAFVLASHGDGFGFVLLEAMACGIPVVASSLDGSKEAVLGGRLGTVVNPKDPADLTAGLLKALNQPKGVPEALDYFSIAQFKTRLSRIFEEILASKRTATA